MISRACGNREPDKTSHFPMSGVAEVAWDVLSGAAKMAWDVLSRVTKTAWDVLSGVAN